MKFKQFSLHELHGILQKRISHYPDIPYKIIDNSKTNLVDDPKMFVIDTFKLPETGLF